jgi:hypothetical protein
MGRQIIIEIVGDATKFSKATSQATASAEGMGGRLKSVGTGIAQGIGQAGFNLLTDAVGMAVSKLGEADQAFKDDQESQALMSKALKNNVPNWDGSTASIEAFAAAQADLGFSMEDVRKGMEQTVGVTHDVAQAQNMISLAEDLARAKGIDLATAVDIVTKAHEGNGKALKALGIDVAGAKTGAELLDAIQNNVAGSADTWAETNTGKLAVSNEKVHDSMVKVGAIIDQVSQVVIPILADAFSTVVDWLSQTYVAVQPVIQTIAKGLQPVFEKIGPIATSIFRGIGDAVKAVLPIFKTVWDSIATVIKTVIGIWITEFDIAKNALGVLGDVFRGIADIVGKVFGTIGGIIKSVINTVIDIVNGAIGAMDAIQVHIHAGPVDMDWNGLGLGYIPRLHSGGIVPGAQGEDVLTMLQAGERVIPVGGLGGAQVVVNMPIQNFYGTEDNISALSRQLGAQVRLSMVKGAA